MTWQVAFTRDADKLFANLDRPVQQRIRRALERLAEAPLAGSNVKALAGGGYRLRVGDYRVIYRLVGNIMLVLVVAVGHRRDIYRGL